MGLHDNVCMSVPYPNRVDSGSRKESQAGPSHHCQTVPEAVGSASGSLQHNSVGSATHEILTVVAQNQGVFPEGKSVPHDQSITALPTSFIDMEKALVSVPGPYIGSDISAVGTDIRCLTQGLGSNPEGPSRIGTVEGPSSPHAYQLLGDVSSVSSSETLLPSSERSPCVSEDRQHIGSLLHQPSRRSEFAPSVQVGEADPSMGSREAALSEGSLHPRLDECGSRPPVETGVGARGMATAPKSGGSHLAEIRQSRRRSIRLSKLNTLPIVVLPHTSSTVGAGCHGADVAEASSVCVSPDRSAPGSPGEGPSRGVQSIVGSPLLAHTSVVLGPDVSPRRSPLGDSRPERPPVPGEGCDSAPSPGHLEIVGVASEGAHLVDLGLSTEVVQTILSSRAPSTRKLYATKWKLFISWCTDHHLDPVHCPVGSVLEFLQERFEYGLTPSTLKVYVAAMSAYRTDGLGRDPLVVRFLRGSRRLRPACASRVPIWDLSIVLEGLSTAPFEPIEDVSEKFLTLKTVFLLAITSLKRVEDLQALSVAPSCLDFSPGMVRAFLYPRAGYIPKVPTEVVRPTILQAFNPPPFTTPDQERLNLLCPVRALDAYVHRTSAWRSTEQLFVLYGPPKMGAPASKQSLSRWIVEAMSLAYEALHRPVPEGIRTHSTRGYGGFESLSFWPVHDWHLQCSWVVYPAYLYKVLSVGSGSYSGIQYPIMN